VFEWVKNFFFNRYTPGPRYTSNVFYIFKSHFAYIRVFSTGSKGMVIYICATERRVSMLNPIGVMAKEQDGFVKFVKNLHKCKQSFHMKKK
jgi:hypothetical protein